MAYWIMRFRQFGSRPSANLHHPPRFCGQRQPVGVTQIMDIVLRVWVCDE
jgi:hypothetical protein